MITINKKRFKEYFRRKMNNNGFSFANYNAHEMFFTLQKAIILYQDKKIWNNLIINAMNTDNSWKKSAQDYIRIFNGLIS